MGMAGEQFHRIVGPRVPLSFAEQPAPGASDVQKPPPSRTKTPKYLAPEIKKRATADELRAAADWEAAHRGLVPANFNQARFNGNEDPLLNRRRTSVKNLAEEGHGWGTDRFDDIDWTEADGGFTADQPHGSRIGFDEAASESGLSDASDITNSEPESSNAELQGQNFDASKLLGFSAEDYSFDLLIARNRTWNSEVQAARKQRRKPSLLELLLSDGDAESKLEAYVAVMDGMSFGRAAKEFDIPNILKSFEQVNTFLLMAEKLNPKFSRALFIANAKRYFSERRKSAAWSFIQRADKTSANDSQPLPDNPGATVWNFPSRERVRNKLEKDDRVYGTDQETVRLEREGYINRKTDALPTAPPTLPERSAFGTIQRFSENRTHPTQPHVFVPRDEDVYQLEKGLLAYLCCPSSCRNRTSRLAISETCNTRSIRRAAGLDSGPHC